MPNELAKETLENTITILLRHCKNKEKFKKNAHNVITGGNDSNDYTNKGIKRSKYCKRFFNNAKFVNSTAAGSTFNACEFDNCLIVNANFQECVFIASEIKDFSKDNPIINTNFNESLFTDAFTIENTHFEHSVFHKTVFRGGIIKDTSFYSCTLEDTTFSNVYMESVVFTDLNIDYSVFEQVKMHKVILPFSQICYTFGLLSYLLETSDEVYITSADNEKGYITKEEFLGLLPHFIQYYSETNDFFPLANIYLFLKDKEKAKEAILSGITMSIIECDFRKIKYLCKLIYTYSIFNFHERKSIYDSIHTHISFDDINSSLLYSYSVFRSEIESYLLNTNRKNFVTAEINITTNIYPEDANKLGILISVIEKCIEEYKSPLGEHKITCRHNSAEAIAIFIQDTFEALKIIVPTIYSVLLGILIIDEKLYTRKKEKINFETLQQHNQKELEKLDLEIEHKRLVIAREKIELEEKQMIMLQEQNKIRQEILRKEITNNNVEVTGVNHIMYGNIPSRIDKNLLQYQTSKLY